MILRVMRLLLVILPFIVLFLWLRTRARANEAHDLEDKDLTKARYTLVGLIALIVVIGIGLKFFSDSGETDLVYIPARVENGQVIPGHFVPKDSEEGMKEQGPSERHPVPDRIENKGDGESSSED